MIPVVTAAEAAEMDRRAEDPVGFLMERAGLAVALEAVELGATYGSRVTVLCGPGNNGGDGYVAARYLRRRGVSVRVEALAEPRTEVAQEAEAAARRAGVPVDSLGVPRSTDLVIDAVFGGGFRKGLPIELEPWLQVEVPVVAVDVPSGVDPDTGACEDGHVRATRTVTFGALKPAHLLAADACGLVTVADIGLAAGDPTMRVVESEDAPLPPRPRLAHKWSAGSVLVVGGGPGMVGAAVMAARAALNFGAGAAAVASEQPGTVAALAPEVLSFSLDDLSGLFDRYDVVVVGPGLGRRPRVVADVVEGAARVVADADALTSVTDLAGADELIVTPHTGEFRRLSDREPGPDAARHLAEELGGVVVLKGWPTYVTDGGVPWAVVSGGPELATIGTGDVLAGMTAALWARGSSALEAARSAAYWHGVAGHDLARTRTVTADLLATHVGHWAGI